MDPNRKLWNDQQQALRQALSRPAEHARAIELFLAQHAMLHAADVSGSNLYSFDNELWHGLSDEAARRIPPGEEHSIAWMIWHLARIEDVTMNLLLAGQAQLYLQDAWMERLKISFRDTGNSLDPVEIAGLSAAIDIPALRAYRIAVGRRTREVVQHLQPQEVKKKVLPARLERVQAEGAVTAAAQWLLDYWGGLTISGLLLMPPTRHNLVHLNEAIRIKRRVLKP
ncbi:MAG TPA: DinB family protein [Anaerolineaceae bacterium]|nr:DinB family protein [Anaerolineaceae bacterium]